MIIDKLNEFAEDVDVSAAAGTALVGDVIDLGVTPQDLGNGKPMYLVIVGGDTAIITGGTAGTIQFELASDAQAAIATDGTASTHLKTGEFVTDDAALNAINIGTNVFMGALPTGAGVAYERYLGVLVTTGTTTTTAGSINAFLTTDPSYWKAYADGAN
tara:strand:+ start:2731 stop:3207 length:477 start_codon:yes stop_codon:yes gene_type:complete